MLTVNMLRDMRTSGHWSTSGDSGGETLGADTFDSTFDVGAVTLSRQGARPGLVRSS